MRHDAIARMPDADEAKHGPPPAADQGNRAAEVFAYAALDFLGARHVRSLCEVRAHSFIARARRPVRPRVCLIVRSLLVCASFVLVLVRCAVRTHQALCYRNLREWQWRTLRALMHALSAATILR